MSCTPFNAAHQPTAALTQPPTRRRFITLAGGGSILASTSLATGCSSGGVSSLPEVAVRPWTPGTAAAGASAAAAGDPRAYMLAHALLAPNPHNRQPWLADLRKPGEITLLCDGQRLLPETDPFGRQVLIGCGAFVELALMAAAQQGYRCELQTFPEGEPAAQALPGGAVVARLIVQRDAAVRPDPLFAHILRRHTNKAAYDNQRSLTPAQWQALTAPAQAAGLRSGAITQPQAMDRVRTLTRQSYEIECTTARTWLESARLFRIGPDDIAQHRDGISINGTMPRLLAALGLFKPLEVPVAGSSNHQRVMERWAAFESGSGYFWIATPGNSRSAQLASGRAYVRAQLQATALGLDMHPLSQALQEFAEVAAPYRAMHRELGFEPGAGPGQHTVQMLARVGYALQAAGPAPRRDVAGLVHRG